MQSRFKAVFSVLSWAMLLLIVGAALSACATPAPATQEPTRIPTTPRPTSAPVATPTATAAPTFTPVPITPTATWTPVPVMATAKENLNIRSGPSTATQIIGRLNKGDVARILGRTAASDWWLIALPNDAAARGWISASFTTVAGPVAQVAVSDGRATPQPPAATPAATTQPAAITQPTASPTSFALLEAPKLVQPGTRASYAARSPVILTWTFSRSIGPGEFYAIQLFREGTEPKDFACTTLTAHQINAPPPLGYGWYQWRILVRLGSIQGSQCVSQGDLSQASETRSFEWREPTAPPIVPYP